MELLLTEIELNEVNCEGMLFDIYFDSETKRFTAKDINGTMVLQYEIDGDEEQIAQEHREEILTYRLGRFTDEDVVEIGDIFMYAKFNKLI
jgi:hypothetical protein